MSGLIDTTVALQPYNVHSDISWYHGAFNMIPVCSKALKLSPLRPWPCGAEQFLKAVT